MHSDLAELGWTEDQWNRILTVVQEEAQRGRVAAQVLPLVGPEAGDTVAVPSYRLKIDKNRLGVDSDPTLYLTRLAVNVHVRTREAADPQLSAVLTMFRRAANFIARAEDALVFNGRGTKGPLTGISGDINAVITINEDIPTPLDGLCPTDSKKADWNAPHEIKVADTDPRLGDRIVTGIIESINELDAQGQLGPYGCVLSPFLFQAICTPNDNLVLPRDRILPFLQAPLLRASVLPETPPKPAPPPGRGAPGAPAAPPPEAWGVVVALSGNPVELDVARDIGVRYLQTSADDARLVFRVSEKVALRIKEPKAIARLKWIP